jgi:hypothetical protein
MRSRQIASGQTNGDTGVSATRAITNGFEEQEAVAA